MKKLNKKRVFFAAVIVFGLIILIAKGIASLFTSEHPSENPCLFNSRVKVAECEKQSALEDLLLKKNLSWNQFELIIRAFKSEKSLEVWGKNKRDKHYKLITSYPFCVLSGTLGPKRKQGDRQVPEGVYHIDRFNSVSTYYLSLGINYPNKSDKIKGHQQHPGSDIFIHGKCVSIGCIPITDDKIKELYVLSNQAKQNGQSRIAVHIFPAKMTRRNVKKIKADFPEHLILWNDLQKIYVDFESNRQKQIIEIDDSGKYILRK